jgi:hypothetical protein
MKRLCFSALMISGVALLLGCGGDGLKRAPVEGKLTAKGQPVSHATVSFIPAEGTLGEGGIGTTDESGNFTLTGSRQGDSGVVPGKYKVIASRFINPDGSVIQDYKQADNPDAIDSVPAPYSGDGSPLEVTVPEDGGPLTVEIPVKLRDKTK